MKRGLSLVTLIALLSIPNVIAASSFLEVFLGSTSESLIFLKLMYATLVFIIILKSAKQFLFKEEGQKRLGTVFSLIIAIFAFRFTPDVVVQGFGRFIMLLMPFLIIFMITGVFQKKVVGEDKKKIPWLRIIISIIGAIIVFALLGDFSSFGGSRAGFFDEAFSDVHYLLFSKLDIMWVVLVGVLLIGGLVYLLSRLRGGKDKEGKQMGNFWKGFFIVIGIILLIALIGGVAGGGWAGLAAIWGIAQWIFWILLIIGIIVMLIYFDFTRNLLLDIFRGIRSIKGKNLYVVLVTPKGRIMPDDTLRTVQVALGSSTPFSFIVYRGFFGTRVFGRVKNKGNLIGAQFNTDVNNGALTPANGQTNNNGIFNSVYTAPNVAGNAKLRVQVTPADINSVSVVPDFTIQIGTIGGAPGIHINSPIGINAGETATVAVEVFEVGTLNGIDNANVTVVFRPAVGLPAMTPFTGVTSSGSRRRSSTITFTTPTFNTAGVYDFVARVRIPGRTDPPDMTGVVNVTKAGTPDLILTSLITKTSTGRDLTDASGTILSYLRKGETALIEVMVLIPGGTATNGATVTLAAIPGFGVGNFNRIGSGTYRAFITSNNSSPIGVMPFTITATQTGYNSAVASINIRVEDLPSLNLTPTLPTGSLMVGNPITINFHVTDDNGANVDNCIMRLYEGSTTSAPLIASGRTNASGIYSYVFTPSTAGDLVYTIYAEPPAGFKTPGPSVTFGVHVISKISDISFIVSWYPNPAKKSTKMALTALDKNDGSYVQGAIVRLSGSSEMRILNTSPSWITDYYGNLPKNISIGLNRAVTAPETQTINIEVQKPGYNTIARSVDITFVPLADTTRVESKTEMFI